MSTKLPHDIGPIHFIGIGGIGMSGIAEVLLQQGFVVQGSDLSGSSITRRLQQLGARIFECQHADNLAGAQVVVVSSAIKPGNPELEGARHLGLPVVRRAEMLAELMRLKSNVAVAGTHGKTTTTTLVASLLDAGGLDPTVINGGIIKAFGSNARSGAGEWMVVEADESDGTFTRLPATIAVVTNIDHEHLEHWGSFEALCRGFHEFVTSIPFYGIAICCTDDPTTAQVAAQVTDRRVLTYGLGGDADVAAVNVVQKGGLAQFDVLLRREAKEIRGCALPMPGEHNVSNALAAIAVAYHLGIQPEVIRQALADFEGVKRRFTMVGQFNGATVIDDYAHHPAEIAAALKAARSYEGARVIAVHQPHRYTRLHTLMGAFATCFADADIVGITEIYTAGENPIAGVTAESLVNAARDAGHPSISNIYGVEGMRAFVQKHVRTGDIVVCLGAGSISEWAAALIDGQARGAA